MPTETNRLPGLTVTLTPGSDAEHPERGAIAHLTVPLDELEQRHAEFHKASETDDAEGTFRETLAEELGTEKPSGRLGTVIMEALGTSAYLGGLDALTWLGIPWNEEQVRARLGDAQPAEKEIDYEEFLEAYRAADEDTRQRVRVRLGLERDDESAASPGWKRARSFLVELLRADATTRAEALDILGPIFAEWERKFGKVPAGRSAWFDIEDPCNHVDSQLGVLEAMLLGASNGLTYGTYVDRDRLAESLGSAGDLCYRLRQQVEAVFKAVHSRETGKAVA